MRASDIIQAVHSVTKKWARTRRAEDRGNRPRASRRHAFSDRVNFTDVAEQILPAGYRHASGDGRYTVSKRTFYYAVREDFYERTGRELGFNYFAQNLLVKYRNRHPETREWKITADPRGTLTIPNADHEVRIPCGTIEIERHLDAEREAPDPLDLPDSIPVTWPSLAPGQRYQGVLYIEKEGFDPMLKEARIAERFDLAILSCKGQSVVAARRFVDEVCKEIGGVPLFVVHDFDKYGFEIAQCLTRESIAAVLNDRVTYEFQNEIDVTDLGLRFEDVEEYGLQSERCDFRGDFSIDSIATKAERDFLRSGRRVELNAFTAPQLLEWLEGKLRDHLTERLIPDDNVLANAYRRALAVTKINSALEEARAKGIEMAKEAHVPDELRARLAEAMEDRDEPWDEVLYEFAREELDEE